MSAPTAAATIAIQNHLQTNNPAAAAHAASAQRRHWRDDPRLAHLSVLAFSRNGDTELAAQCAGIFEDNFVPSADIAVTMADAFLAVNDYERAYNICMASLAEGFDNARLRTMLASLARYNFIELDEALEHAQAALVFAPDDPKCNSLCGEILLRSGRSADAVGYLEKSARLAPHLPAIRVLLSRALRYSGQVGAAADSMLAAHDIGKTTASLDRYTIAALVQAGRQDEAEILYVEYRERRSHELAVNLRAGLKELWDCVDEVNIPRARLDWAWQFAGDDKTDRQAWERAARWGYLADHLLLDWIECRSDRLDEAVALLANLDTHAGILADRVDGNSGMILAAAHIGPMYGGPLALSQLPFDHRWLASAPTIPGMPYVDRLISTSDRSETQVGKQVLRSLRDGNIITMALDGAMSPSAPRIMFEGQPVTYSDFAPRTVYKTGAASMFGVPRWREGRIEFDLEDLPAPEPGESIEQFTQRWTGAYAGCLRRHLSGEPENLRLAGGIWRHIC